MRVILHFLLLVAFLGLSACGGDSDGEPHGAANNTTDNNSGNSEFANSEEFFTSRIQPRMDFCRTCHIPGGVADTDEGRRFMLSSNSGDDYANAHAAWQAMGSGVETSPLLIENADMAEPHSGGKNWQPGSDAYNDMVTLLTCWDEPVNCALSSVGDAIEALPLLGSLHAEHLWESYCEGKADDVSLPADPRTRIQPGVNEGKAVFYNSYWEDCHVNLPEKEKHAKTCGEYRSRRDRGKEFVMGDLMHQGDVGKNLNADSFNNFWRAWGLDERPENYDQMVTLRYGLNRAPFDNPYPIPGEDPNETNGGSGQLPLGYRQMKDENGNWTGEIASSACFKCHGGQIGDPFEDEPMHVTLEHLGVGNNNYDVWMLYRDNSGYETTPFADFAPYYQAPIISGYDPVFFLGIKQRGQNNAVGAFEFLHGVLDIDSMGLNPNPLKMYTLAADPLQGLQDTSHPLAHSQDTPPWWNYAFKPRKFFDGGISTDSTRIIMSAGGFGPVVSDNGKYYRTRIEKHDQDMEAFFLSLNSPQWPEEVDTKLAEQGAVLFHTKNLWAEEGNADAPKPLGGNGSCASCHGAYSPRYVNDPDFLEDPALEGVAGHISPLEVIGTDTARSDMLTPTLRAAWATSYFGYPDNTEGWVSPEEKDPLTELLDDMYPLSMRPKGVCGWQQDVIGYQAPPLYGVWATAPYLHNGSVPTLEQLLDSSQRPAIWQRKLQEIGPVKGFDQRMSVAFDYERVGWKHDALSCGDLPGDPSLNCNPADEESPSMMQALENFLHNTINFTGYIGIPDPAPGSIDKRLVYDSRILSNGNGGHTFSDVLTEQERAAIIEYMKTL